MLALVPVFKHVFKLRLEHASPKHKGCVHTHIGPSAARLYVTTYVHVRAFKKVVVSRLDFST